MSFLRILLIQGLLVFSFSLWGASGVLTPLEKEQNKVAEGSLFEAKLSLEADGILTEKDFESIDKKDFNPYFLFLDSSKVSDREYHLRLLLKQTPTDVQTMKWRLGEKELDIQVTGFYFTAPQNLPKDFYIQDQALSWKTLLNIKLLYGALIFFIIFSYPLWRLIRRFYLKKKMKKERAYKKEYWQSFFYAAQTRAQFEEIGLRKNEWLSLLTQVPEECHRYFSTLEQYQYKKEISDRELKEIKQALNGMKDVLERTRI